MDSFFFTLTNLNLLFTIPEKQFSDSDNNKIKLKKKFWLILVLIFNLLIFQNPYKFVQFFFMF